MCTTIGVDVRGTWQVLLLDGDPGGVKPRISHVCLYMRRRQRIQTCNIFNTLQSDTKCPCLFMLLALGTTHSTVGSNECAASSAISLHAAYGRRHCTLATQNNTSASVHPQCTTICSHLRTRATRKRVRMIWPQKWEVRGSAEKQEPKYRRCETDSDQVNEQETLPPSEQTQEEEDVFYELE